MLQVSQYKKQGVQAENAIIKNSSRLSLLTYPIINTAAFRATMDNYMMYVQQYNINILPKLNIEVDNHNNLVEAYNKENNATKLEIAALTKKFRNHIKETYGCGITTTTNYNEYLAAFNADNIVKIPKRKHHKIKMASKEVFACILSHCSFKLKKRNLSRMQHGERTVLTPEDGFSFPITAFSLTNLKIKVPGLDIDVPKLDVCQKTVRNHISRFIDCGVIKNYKYRGYQLAPEMTINPEILQILEGDIPYQKQLPQGALRKTFPVNSSSYSTENENKDNKAISKENALDKEELKAVEHVRSILNPNASNSDGSNSVELNFYRNNKKQGYAASPKRKKIAAKKEKKITVRASFQELIDKNTYETANQLAAGAYDNYKPLPMQHLHDEANKGGLLKAQFRKIVMYDFLFTAAKLWKGKNVYVGEWINTIKYFETYFLNGPGGIFKKQTQIDRLVALRWRVNWANSYCMRHPEFKLLYPSSYFDHARKNSYDGGFAYTNRHYQKHLNYLETNNKERKTSRRNAYQREITHKIRLKVREYIRGKRSFEKLTEYVENLEKKHLKEQGSLALAMSNIIIDEREKQKHEKAK